MGEWHEGLDRVVNFFAHLIRPAEVVAGDVFSDFFQILDRVRMKNKLAHEPARRCSLFRRNSANAV